MNDLIDSQLQALQIKSKHLVDSLLSGKYRTCFKGQGLEFEDSRQYYPGDDIRHIDWRVTARTRIPHTKRYLEERELNLSFLLDCSASMRWGNADRNKIQTAQEIISTLSYAALKNNDRAGFVACSDKIEGFVPAGRGRNQHSRILHELLSLSPKSKQTDLSQGLNFIEKTCSHRNIIFILSDLLCDNYDTSLQALSEKHDIIVLLISDTLEKNFSNAGLIHLSDSESGEDFYYDSSQAKNREAFRNHSIQQRKHSLDHCQTRNVDVIEIDTAVDFMAPLIQFFQHRHILR